MVCILKWVSFFKALMGKSFKTVKAWPSSCYTQNKALDALP